MRLLKYLVHAFFAVKPMHKLSPEGADEGLGGASS